MGEQDPVAEAVSDPRGRYRLAGVLPGTQCVGCEAAGFVWASSQPVEVRERQESGGVDLALRRGGFVVGRVVLPDAKTPASQARLWLEPLGDASSYQGAVLGATIEEDASFRTAPEPPGAYRLRAELPVAKGRARTHRGAVPRIVVQPGRETRVRLDLKPIR